MTKNEGEADRRAEEIDIGSPLGGGISTIDGVYGAGDVARGVRQRERDNIRDIGPGARALTRMPSLVRASASDLIGCTIAPLMAA